MGTLSVQTSGLTGGKTSAGNLRSREAYFHQTQCYIIRGEYQREPVSQRILLHSTERLLSGVTRPERHFATSRMYKGHFINGWGLRDRLKYTVKCQGFACISMQSFHPGGQTAHPKHCLSVDESLANLGCFHVLFLCFFRCNYNSVSSYCRLLCPVSSQVLPLQCLSVSESQKYSGREKKNSIF